MGRTTLPRRLARNQPFLKVAKLARKPQLQPPLPKKNHSTPVTHQAAPRIRTRCLWVNASCHGPPLRTNHSNPSCLPLRSKSQKRFRHRRERRLSNRKSKKACIQVGRPRGEPRKLWQICRRRPRARRLLSTDLASVCNRSFLFDAHSSRLLRLSFQYHLTGDARMNCTILHCPKSLRFRLSSCEYSDRVSESFEKKSRPRYQLAIYPRPPTRPIA